MEPVQPVLEQLFSTFGFPIEYKSYNGPPFQSYRFAEFAKHWSFKHRRRTPYWLRANAEVESFMKNLGKMIRTAKIAGINKMQALQDFIRVYNETPHSSTKVSPAMLIIGFSRT